jgi:hypothetical protein
MNCGIISAARRRSSGTVAPILVTAGTMNSNTGNSTLPVSYPSGIAAGDIILLHTLAKDPLGDADVSSITGSFTQADLTNANDNFSQLWWKRADGTEGASETVTFSQAADGPSGVLMAQMSAWRGCVGTGTPYEALTHTSQASTASHVGSTITTLGANRVVVSMFTQAGGSVAGTNTNGWTEQWDNGTVAGSGGYMNGSSIVAATAGSVSAITRTMNSAIANISFTLALIPA